MGDTAGVKVDAGIGATIGVSVDVDVGTGGDAGIWVDAAVEVEAPAAELATVVDEVVVETVQGPTLAQPGMVSVAEL